MLAQIRTLLISLTLRQRILVAVAGLATIGGLWWLNHWNRERVFQPLFTGLAAEDAGAVVTKLKEGGVDYRLSADGNTVLAPSSRIPELRIQLASSGIPKAGRIGFELFDKTNFGLTDFAEQVNYRRAIEGELERSVLALHGVESARIHITPAKESVFTDSKEPAKASILLTLKRGAKFMPANVDAISHLVSSAVQGLDPEHVSVVDGAGRLLVGANRQQAPQEEADAADKALLYRQKIERDLLDKVNSTLEPLLGANRFRAGVSVECDFSSGEQSEETFDPAKSVVATAQKSDESGVPPMAGGQPGTASNLPRPTPRLTAGTASVTRKTENTTYQNSRLVRKVKLPQGGIRRISAAVLIDNYLRWEVENGKPKRVLTPPPPEQMKSIRDLVSGAVGVDARRGDSLVVESIAFGSTLEAEPPPGLTPIASKPPDKTPALDPAKDGWMGIPKSNLMIMGGVGGAASLALLGGLFWLSRKRRRTKISAETVTAAIAEGGPSPSSGKKPQAGGETTEGQAEIPALSEKEAKDLAAIKALQEEKQVLGAIKLPETTSKKAVVLTRHIAEEAKKNPVAVAQIVRTWLNAEDEK
jgi:flagellar M-ring protein FliF